MSQPVELRHRHFLNTTKDSHAAALLVVAEQVQSLVGLLADVDAAVERIEQTTTPTEIVQDIPPIPAVNVNIIPAAAEYIQKTYLS